MSDMNAIRSQVRQIAVTDQYRTRSAAHAILKVHEEDAMNYALFAPLSTYREREGQLADRHIKQNVNAHQSCVGEGMKCIWSNFIFLLPFLSNLLFFTSDFPILCLYSF